MPTRERHVATTGGVTTSTAPRPTASLPSLQLDHRDCRRPPAKPTRRRVSGSCRPLWPFPGRLNGCPEPAAGSWTAGGRTSQQTTNGRFSAASAVRRDTAFHSRSRRARRVRSSAAASPKTRRRGDVIDGAQAKRRRKAEGREGSARARRPNSSIPSSRGGGEPQFRTRQSPSIPAASLSAPASWRIFATSSARSRSDGNSTGPVICGNCLTS